MATEKIILSAVDQTRAAFQSVQGNISKLSKSLGGLGGPLAAAFSVAAIGAYTKNILEAADSLSKLSQKTGVSVEDLSSFQLAADLAGIGTEAFESGLKRLSKNIAEARNGVAEQADAFRELGITQGDLNKLPTAKILEKIADAYAKAADDSGKLNNATKIGGKTFADWIPLLNTGSEGLRQFGATMSTEFARDAEAFNDNLRKLSELVKRFTVYVIGPAIKAINEFFGSYTEKGLEEQLQKLREQLKALKEESVGAGDQYGAGIDDLAGSMQGSSAAIAETEAKIKTLEEALKKLKGTAESVAKIKIGDFSKDIAGKNYAAATDDFSKSLSHLDGVLTDIQTPASKYYEELRKLEEQQRTGLPLYADEYLDALQQINDRYATATPTIARAKTGLEEYADATRNFAKQIDDVAVNAMRNLEDALLGVFSGTMTVKDAFKSMAVSIIQDLIRIQIQRQITGPLADALGGLFGGSTSSSSSSLGTGLTIRGSNAIGGSVQSGSTYMVGERGPEMFVPNASGSIVPNDKLGSGGGTTIVNLNISTGVAQTVRAEIQSLMPRITEATKAAVADAKRRGGTYGKMMA